MFHFFFKQSNGGLCHGLKPDRRLNVLYRSRTFMTLGDWGQLQHFFPK